MGSRCYRGYSIICSYCLIVQQYFHSDISVTYRYRICTAGRNYILELFCFQRSPVSPHLFVVCLYTPINGIKDPSKSEICQTKIDFYMIYLVKQYLKTWREIQFKYIIRFVSCEFFYLFIYEADFLTFWSEER